MLRVGLTGGVGSGKSKVATMLGDLGAFVSRSDDVGRALMQPGQPVMQAIVAHFGQCVLDDAGALDRERLAAIAFSDGRVEELNALVHPAVIAEQARWMAAKEAADAKSVAVIESALIFETQHGEETGGTAHAAPWRTRFDRIVVVTASEDVRRTRYIDRVCACDRHANAATAAGDFDRRSRAQWSEVRKAGLADFVLPNDGPIDDLLVRVQGLYAVLKQESIEQCEEAM